MTPEPICFLKNMDNKRQLWYNTYRIMSIITSPEQIMSITVALEKIKKQDVIRDHFRNNPYAPTPLNPYSLTIDGNRVGFSQYAQTTLAERFDDNLASLGEENQPSRMVADLLQMAINNALFRRLENNDNKSIPEDCDDRSAELFVKACQGIADQAELLELLKSQPSLGSVELAKETNPFIWNQTTAMDKSVADATADFQPINSPPRYYFTSTNLQRGALIVVRKQDIADENNLVVVQRDCLAIDLRQPATRDLRTQLIEDTDILMKSSLHNGQRNIPIDSDSVFGRLMSSLVEPEMLPIENHSTVLYPGARSYYAHYRPF